MLVLFMEEQPRYRRSYKNISMYFKSPFFFSCQSLKLDVFTVRSIKNKMS